MGAARWCGAGVLAVAAAVLPVAISGEARKRDGV